MPPGSSEPLRVLFATAELSPLVRVGGLAQAAAGLSHALAQLGADVEVVLPDYGGWALDDETVEALDVPPWLAYATARRGVTEHGQTITLIDAPEIARAHPYLDPATGEGWVDNDLRFFSFSTAIAALTRRRAPDILHLNDWHTGWVLGQLESPPASVLTIHTIAYQGITAATWLDRTPFHRAAYAWLDAMNPLAGAISLADRVVAVSPTYSREILTPEFGEGLEDRLRALGDRLVGIRNGIDTEEWDPLLDPHLAAHYHAKDATNKAKCRAALLREIGWTDDGSVIVGMVTRLAAQKGVDLALDAARFLPDIPARLVLLGAGDRQLATLGHDREAALPGRLIFREGYDDAFGHQIFGGADLLAMPSRFEPCGLAQMQAMAYGTLPVVTDVGGLHDTVIDDDRHRGQGTGFVSGFVDSAGLVDALHRGARAIKQPARRRALQRRGMSVDWSWSEPARRHLDLYHDLLATRSTATSSR